MGGRRLFQDLPYLLVSGVTIEPITRVTALKGKKDIYKIKAVFKVPEEMIFSSVKKVDHKVGFLF